MRIAYLVSEYPAPSHTFIRREINGLRDRGVSINIFSIRRPPDHSIYSREDDLSRNETTYVLPVQWRRLVTAHIRSAASQPGRYFNVLRLALRHRVSGLKSLVWSLFYFVEAIQIASELKSAGISHLHNHFANSGATVGLLAAKFADIPWSMTLHGISETDFPAGVLLGEKVKAARFVACASYFIRAQAMRMVPPQYWDKLIIVRCAVDLATMPKPTLRSALPAVVAVGRLSPEKGFHGLLRAFSKVRNKGTKARLIIVGGGAGLADLKSEIESLGLEDHVTLTGGMSESNTLQEIANADILVLSSLMEGLPVVLIEALALGVPAIASHIAGIPELIVQEQTGLLFRPTDWDDLAAKLEILLIDADLRARLARAGRQKIEAEYTIQRSAETMQRSLEASSPERGAPANARTIVTSQASPPVRDMENKA